MSTKTETKTKIYVQWRVMVKFRWSSKFVQMKDWGGPRIFRSRGEAKEYIQHCLDPEKNYRYGYTRWPFEGAEFRTEGRTITVNTTTETEGWTPAHKIPETV